MISEYGIREHVRFWGRVSQAKKYELMARAHILLHASVKEGWGLVVLEAALSGTPSVVYNVGGLRDIVRDGVTGVVVQDSSPHSMARDAIRLFADKKQYSKIQREGRAWVKSITWDDAARQSEELLEKAAGNRS